MTYIKSFSRSDLLTLAVFRDILVGEHEGKVFVKDKDTQKWHHFGYIFPAIRDWVSSLHIVT